MSYLNEVEEAIRVIQEAGGEQLILLHCVSNYPTPPEDANLRAMQTLSNAFQRPVGYSDHTPGIQVAVAAVALGACVIEKHFTLSKTLPGPDHQASLEPQELKELVKAIRMVEKALGHGCKEPMPSEANTRQMARRSLVVSQDLEAGATLEPHFLQALRPAQGISPTCLNQVIGRTLRQAIRTGEFITWSHLS